MVIYSKTSIRGFLVYTGTETQVMVDDIDPYEGKLTVYFILGRKFNIRVFGVKILLKFRDVGFVLKDKLKNFTIIGRAQSTDHIRLLESVYIRHLNPDLNDMETAMPLHII